jgi:hypothetical protein
MRKIPVSTVILSIVFVALWIAACKPSEDSSSDSPTATVGVLPTSVLTSTPEPTPQPEPTSPPPFSGIINGISFVGPQQLPKASDFSPKCTGFNVREASAQEASSSDLDFQVTYLPVNAQLRRVGVSACEDDIVLILREYVLPQGGLIQVVRRRGPAIFASEDAPRDLVPVIVGERPAAKGEFIIYMRDERSAWQVILKGVNISELAMIADGIRAPG